jgi:hypothetical protein
MSKAWNYTAAERRTIDRAYSAVSYIVDHTGDGYTLAEALRHERRERSCVTVAKALIVAGFADGRKRNPRAAELAHISAGIMRAAILGAKSRRLEKRGTLAGTLRELPKLAAAAAAANDTRRERGLSRAFAG